MTQRELANIKDLISELWDFFTTNTDSDETGLVESVSPKYVAAKESISNEFFKLQLRAALSKVRRQYKK